MADFSYDSSFSPIDPSATREYVSSGNRGYSPTESMFSSLYKNLIGPTAMAGASYMGSAPGSGLFGRSVIATAITSAVGGGGYGSAAGGGGGFAGGAMRGNMGGMIGPPPSPPGGGAGFGAPPGPPGMGGGATGAGFGPDAMQGNIDAMFNNNMVFLMMQTKVQNLSQQMQSISNIFKADHDARSNAIRNFRS